MRRSDIVEGIQQVLDALAASGLGKTGLGVNSGGSTENPSGLLRSLRDYDVQARQFTVAAHRIADLFGLNRLRDLDVWVQLVQGSEPTGHGHLRSAIYFALTYLPSVRAVLLDGLPDATKTRLETDAPPPQNILPVVLVERPNNMSRPSRLADLLLGVQALYHVAASLRGVDSDTLVVGACDSGSEESFDFLGIPEVIEAVKQIIVDIWDRVVLLHHLRHKALADTITGSLPALVEINQSAESRAITPEQAELLRRALTEGVTKFLNCGAVTPDIEERSYRNPQQLMLPERVLLYNPEPESSAQSDTSETPEPETPEDEMQSHKTNQLKTLFEKLNRKGD